MSTRAIFVRPLLAVLFAHLTQLSDLTQNLLGVRAASLVRTNDSLGPHRGTPEDAPVLFALEIATSVQAAHARVVRH